MIFMLCQNVVLSSAEDLYINKILSGFVMINYRNEEYTSLDRCNLKAECLYQHSKLYKPQQGIEIKKAIF